jgi:hypothetical protein
MTFIVSKDCFSAKNYSRKRGILNLWLNILLEAEYIDLLQEEKKRLRERL